MPASCCVHWELGQVKASSASRLFPFGSIQQLSGVNVATLSATDCSVPGFSTTIPPVIASSYTELIQCVSVCLFREGKSRDMHITIENHNAWYEFVPLPLAELIQNTSCWALKHSFACVEWVQMFWPPEGFHQLLCTKCVWDMVLFYAHISWGLIGPCLTYTDEGFQGWNFLHSLHTCAHECSNAHQDLLLCM